MLESSCTFCVEATPITSQLHVHIFKGLPLPSKLGSQRNIVLGPSKFSGRKRHIATLFLQAWRALHVKQQRPLNKWREICHVEENDIRKFQRLGLEPTPLNQFHPAIWWSRRNTMCLSCLRSQEQNIAWPHLIYQHKQLWLASCTNSSIAGYHARENDTRTPLQFKCMCRSQVLTPRPYFLKYYWLLCTIYMYM